MNAFSPAGLCAERRRSRLVWLVASIIGPCVLMAPAASRAMPVIAGDLTIVENRPVDDFFGFPGLHLLTRVDATHADGPTALTGPPAGAKVSASNGAFPFANPSTLPLFSPTGLLGTSSWAQLFAITPASFSTIQGTYTYTVTDNNSVSSTHVGNNLNFAAVVPHPTNLAVSDYSTTPLFTFTDPAPNPAFSELDRVYDAVIFDSAGNEIAILPSPTTSSTTPAFQIPSGLLTPGQQYWFRAQSIDIDTTDFHVENIGESLLSFTAVPESSHVMALGGLLMGLMALRARRMRA